jgi:hypothetical protein
MARAQSQISSASEHAIDVSKGIPDVLDFVIRLRARNLCDGGSATFSTLRVLPPIIS